MEYVTVIDSAPPAPGGVINTEALILCLGVGASLHFKQHINPVGVFLGGLSAAFVYRYLFTLRLIAPAMNAIASLGWAMVVTLITSGFWHTKGNHYDWVWGLVLAGLIFYLSWKAHTSGAQELRREGVKFVGR